MVHLRPGCLELLSPRQSGATSRFLSDPPDSVLCMAEGVRVVGSGEAPGWIRRTLSLTFDDTDGGLLPVSGVLLQVPALPAGPEAIPLLHGLAGRPMDYREQLRVIEL